MDPHSKKAKLEDKEQDLCQETSKTAFYILPHKIQKRRLDVLKHKCREQHLPCVENFR